MTHVIGIVAMMTIMALLLRWLSLLMTLLLWWLTIMTMLLWWLSWQCCFSGWFSSSPLRLGGMSGQAGPLSSFCNSPQNSGDRWIVILLIELNMNIFLRWLGYSPGLQSCYWWPRLSCWLPLLVLFAANAGLIVKLITLFSSLTKL